MAGKPEALHGYHAHIYYDEASSPTAFKLLDSLASDFPVQIGKNNGAVAGPHPVRQIQVIFKNNAFQQVVSWLMLNREGLDVLVHPLSDDEYEDHTSNALWLGNPVKLKLDVLKHSGYPADLLPK